MPRDSKDKKERPEPVHDIGDVTDSVVADVFDMARLDPAADSMAGQKAHLKAILEHFKVLNQMHLEGLDPTIQINPTPIPLRADEVRESLSVEQALANARYRAGGAFFLAPKILGGEKVDEG